MSSSALNLSPPELILRLNQQELVAEFGRFALRMDNFQAILDEACSVAARGLEAGFAKVLEYLPGDMMFLVRAGVGWKDGVIGHARLGGDLQSPAGYAFRSGKPVVSNHLTNEQRFRTPALLAEYGIRSAINVLIGAGDAEAFGVLEGDSTRRGEFGEHDVAFLQALANTLAVAVEAQKRQDARVQMLSEKEALLRENAALLREKDLLMQEVHHRVANSLQLGHSVLMLQALTYPEAKAQLQEAAGRIMTIAAVHTRLYEGGSVVAADVGSYLRRLVTDIEGLFVSEAAERTLELEVGSFSLSAEAITPLGLIISELITNALKHGRGKIRVEVRQDVSGLQLSVSDEGTGFPTDFDPTARRGIGMRLVTALAKGPPDAVTIDRSVAFGRIAVRTGFGGSGSGEDRC
jgi:two-component sensor histidine kinase